MEVKFYLVIGARSALYTLLSLAVFILAVIAVCVAVGSLTAGGATTHFTLWNIGCNGSPDNSPYTDFNNTIRAARAFGILTILLTVPCFILGMIDLLNKRACFGDDAANSFKWFMIFAAFICFVCATIAWPIMFGLPHMLSDDFGAPSTWSISGAGPVMLVAWVLLFCMMLLAFFASPAIPEDHVIDPVTKQVVMSPNRTAAGRFPVRQLYPGQEKIGGEEMYPEGEPGMFPVSKYPDQPQPASQDQQYQMQPQQARRSAESLQPYPNLQYTAQLHPSQAYLQQTANMSGSPRGQLHPGQPQTTGQYPAGQPGLYPGNQPYGQQAPTQGTTYPGSQPGLYPEPYNQPQQQPPQYGSPKPGAFPRQAADTDPYAPHNTVSSPNYAQPVASPNTHRMP